AMRGRPGRGPYRPAPRDTKAHPPCLAVSLFLSQGPQGGERMRLRIARDPRLEGRPLLARIRVDAEQQKLGRDHAEIDLASDHGFRRLVVAEFDCRLAPLVGDAWRIRSEYKIDGFIQFVLDRLERDHAILSDDRVHFADNMKATAAAARHIERRA